jgi:DNA-binding XRE family transcriptional regulator
MLFIKFKAHFIILYMKTPNRDILPSRLQRSLAKLGSDISIARRKRSLTIDMMAERVGVAKATYFKVEKGDPTVSMGVYAMSLFVLGFSDALGTIADASRDDTGLLLDADRLPKRIRISKRLAGL